MNTKEIATKYRLTHWAGIMHDRVESDLSIRAYCKQSGFHENIYYYWQRKLREAGAVIIKSSEIKITIPEHNTANNKKIIPNGWAACSVIPANNNSSGAIEIEVNGCHITVTANTDMELFMRTFVAPKKITTLFRQQCERMLSIIRH